jgi:voltage-gated potassium channel Kch
VGYHGCKTYTNHIIVCGVGELGKALVKRLHADHPEARFVLVDQRSGVLTETGLLGDNVICIQADMTSIETLKKVNCHKARLVLLASGNDAFNLEAAYKIVQLSPQTRSAPAPQQPGRPDGPLASPTDSSPVPTGCRYSRPPVRRKAG